MRVIITGATGTVGIALIEECIRRKIEILVLTREDSKRNYRIPIHPLVQQLHCSLHDLSKLENHTGKSYDVFYHLAWEGTTGKERDDMYLQNRNVQYALDAVAAAHRFGCHLFVGAGSQAEYGRVEGLLQEMTPVHPDMGYGIGKLSAGLMTREYAHQLGMQHLWVRILSIYGPNDGLQSMVMSVIRNLLSGQSPKLTKGEQMWDYLYCEDAARALCELGYTRQDGKTYILGGGAVRPLKEYVQIIRDIVAPDAEIAFGSIPYSPRQVMYLCADLTALKNDIGFCPQVTFEEGIQRTLKWYKEEMEHEKNS